MWALVSLSFSVENIFGVVFCSQGDYITQQHFFHICLEPLKTVPQAPLFPFLPVISFHSFLVLFWVHNANRPQFDTLQSVIHEFSMYADRHHYTSEDPEQAPPPHLSINLCIKARVLNWAILLEETPQTGVNGSYLSLSAVKMTLRSSRREANTRRSRRKLREENRHSKSTCSRRESEGRHNSITYGKRRREKRD